MPSSAPDHCATADQPFATPAPISDVDRSLSLLRSTLDATGDGILVVDDAGVPVTCNRVYAEMWGVPFEACVPDLDRVVFNGILAQLAEPDAFLATIAQQQERPGEPTFDLIALRDGRAFEYSSHPQREGDEIVGRVITFRDVTARMATERQLQRRLYVEEALAWISRRLVAPGDVDLAAILGVLGEIVGAHRAHADLAGEDARFVRAAEWHAHSAPRRAGEVDVPLDASPHMVRGQPVIIDDVAALSRAERERMEACGVYARLVIPVARLDGRLLGVLTFDDRQRARRWHDDDLRALLVAGEMLAGELDRRAAARQLRESEERLRESEQRLGLVLAATTDGVWDWDLANDRITFSDGWWQMTGYAADETFTSTTAWFALLHPDDVPEARAALTAHLRGDTAVYESEQRIRAKDGRWLWLHSRGKVVARDARGRAVRAVGTHTDSTERHVGEQQRRELESQLQQAQKMEAVGRLAGGIAHDFNNLLTAVIGHAELLLRRLDAGDRRRTHAEEIRRAAERTASLTQQLLAFSRKQLLRPRMLDLNAAVQETESILRRLIGEDIVLETALQPKLGSVLADPGQLQQVILNLAVNARDAMPDGGRLVLATSSRVVGNDGASRFGTMRPGRYAVLTVTDTGHGMSTETMANVFEPFFTTKEVGKGTGLGLSTVYGIVKQSEGYIWMDSREGEGTEFHVYLPLQDVAAHEDEDASPEDDDRRGQGIVLVAEDEPVVRKLVVELLGAAGYTVHAGATPMEALAIAERMPRIDLLLTDVVMPGMHGRELARRLTERCVNLKVLFMSGYTDHAVIDGGFVEPGLAFINKPFSPRQLMDRVTEMLAGAEVAR